MHRRLAPPNRSASPQREILDPPLQYAESRSSPFYSALQTKFSQGEITSLFTLQRDTSQLSNAILKKQIMHEQQRIASNCPRNP